ncbi:MAG: CapA family protein [Candidatus Portnoybacteria bacterium]|nr:CapA family protein [Candidatus Portnoybacteria bacterium]
MSRRKIIFICVAAAVILFFSAAVFIFRPSFVFVRLTDPETEIWPNISNLEKKPITLLFAGDIMLSRSVGKKMAELENWKWPFEKIGEYLSGADLTFGNLESVISDEGRNVGSIYSFRADPRVAAGLVFAGFDVLSVANNHIGDWGRLAFEDSFKILEENGIGHAGGGFSEEEAHQAVIKEVEGTKFAFLAYTTLGAKWTEAVASSSGAAWLDERISEDIGRARGQADIVIISIHFGEEYQTKSNSFQQKIARAAIDSGADLVIGHHPHVAQETENYKCGWIAYSLGNFIFDQYFSKETMEGMLLRVIVRNGKIESFEPIRIKITSDYQAVRQEE